MLMALARARPGKASMSSDMAAGLSAAAPTPWTTRPANSVPWSAATAASSVPTVNRAEPAVNMPRRPNRSARRPDSSSRPPKATTYAFTIHVASAAPSPRSAWIDGSATFTIEVSSMTTNWADTSSPKVSDRPRPGKPGRSSRTLPSAGADRSPVVRRMVVVVMAVSSFVVGCLVRRPARR